MDAKLAVIADAASEDAAGKLNILGLFDTISAKSFPARHPRLVLVLRFDCDPAELGQEKDVSVSLRTPDGQKVFDLQGKLAIPRPKAPLLRTQLILELVDLIFPVEGEYEFYILIEGESKATIPIFLTKAT